MNITFKNVNGVCEASPKYFNYESEKHEPIYTIIKALKGYDILNKGNKIGNYKKQSDAKKYIVEIYLHESIVNEVEQGFADGGGWSGGVCITGDGNGFAWHKDENGNIVRD